MLGILFWLKSLWRKTTLIHLKISLFTIICTGVFIDFTLKIDLNEKVIDYKNGSASLPVIILLIVSCLIMIVFDFWVENVKAKQRTQNEIISLLKNDNISDNIKSQALEILREKA